MSEYEEVRDRANVLLERLEAFESGEGEKIDMKRVIGEVCHLRGAFISSAFVHEADKALLAAALARAEKAEKACERRTRERDRARAHIIEVIRTGGLVLEDCDVLALADEPEEVAP